MNLGAPELLIIFLIIGLPLMIVGAVVLVARTATGRRCRSCGASLQPGQRFCGQCGVNLAG